MDLENAYDKIYRYVYFRLKNQTAAEDITQETFLRFISKKGSVNKIEMPYMYTIARNLCIDEYRRVKPESFTDGSEIKAAAPSDDPDERIMVRDAFARLSAEYQEILLLRHINNESIATISKALNISRFAVYRRLKAAEEKLRDFLEVIE